MHQLCFGMNIYYNSIETVERHYEKPTQTQPTKNQRNKQEEKRFPIIPFWIIYTKLFVGWLNFGCTIFVVSMLQYQFYCLLF